MQRQFQSLRDEDDDAVYYLHGLWTNPDPDVLAFCLALPMDLPAPFASNPHPEAVAITLKWLDPSRPGAYHREAFADIEDAWDHLCQNTNEEAIRFLFSYKHAEIIDNLHALSWVGLLQNPSPLVSHYLIQWIMTQPADQHDVLPFQHECSMRTDDTMVHWLIANPSFIAWTLFIYNDHDDAVRCCEQAIRAALTGEASIMDQAMRNEPDLLERVLGRFIQLTHPVSTAFCIDVLEGKWPQFALHDPERFWMRLCENDTDRAVDYVLAHVDHIDFRLFCRNVHPRAIAFVQQHPNALNTMIAAVRDHDSPYEIVQDYMCMNPHPNSWNFLFDHCRPTPYSAGRLLRNHHPLIQARWFEHTSDEHDWFDAPFVTFEVVST